MTRVTAGGSTDRRPHRRPRQPRTRHRCRRTFHKTDASARTEVLAVSRRQRALSCACGLQQLAEHCRRSGAAAFHTTEATCVTLLANAHLKETRLQGTKAFSGAIAPTASHARHRRRRSRRPLHRPSKPKSPFASIRLPTTWARLKSKLTRGLAMRSGQTRERDGTRVYRVKGAMKPLWA